jgi:2-polyprenyl-6-methoxyphenol hydroxylase-like FAD-dependent oxidoreductase
VLVLEKAETPHSPLKQLPFGLRGLNALSIEALDRRGLLHELEAHKRVQARFTATAKPGGKPQAGGHFAGIQFPGTLIDASQWPYRLPSSTDTQLLTELEELETVLARRAAALGVVIARGQGITELQQTADGVAVHTPSQTFTGAWLVGCDGGRSAVRKLAGFDFAGTEPTFTGYTAQVDLADPEQLKQGRQVTPAGMYMQSQPGYLILQEFDGGAFHSSGQPVTREHLQELLRRISGLLISTARLAW